MNLNFRPAREADIRRITRLVDEAYLPQVRRFYGDSARGRWLHYDEARVKDYQDREAEGVRVGEAHGRLLSVCVCRAYGSLGWFHSLAVHPDYHQRGLGRQAVLDAQAYLQAQDVRQIGLMTWPDAVANLGFYQRLGYRVAGFSCYAYRRTQPPIEIAATGLRSHYFSALDEGAQAGALAAVAALGSEITPGLDYRPWLTWTENQGLGDTLLLWREGRLLAAALCYQRRRADWLEGKVLMISPAASESEQAQILEHLRRWAAKQGRGSFGFPIDLMQVAATALVQRYDFRLFGDSMVNMLGGEVLPQHGVHCVRFGG